MATGVDTFVEIARCLRNAFPIRRLTCYARVSTLRKFKRDAINIPAQAGLNRVHIGLESGDAGILRFHRKGQTPEMVKEASAWLKEAGVETSYYVLLGLGGRDHWRRHIQEKARLINETEPEFVRIRRLWPYESNNPFSGQESPHLHEIRAGNFIPQTPEVAVLELRLLIEQLRSNSTVVTCDHGNNYVQVSGRIDEDKQTMLAKIDASLALPESDREAHYQAVGSRI